MMRSEHCAEEVRARDGMHGVAALRWLEIAQASLATVLFAVVIVRGIGAILAPPASGAEATSLAITLGAAALLGAVLGALAVRTRFGHETMRESRDHAEAFSPAGHPYRESAPIGASPARAPRRTWVGLGVATVLASCALGAGLVALDGLPAEAPHKWLFLEAVPSPLAIGFAASPTTGNAWTLEDSALGTGGRLLVVHASDDPRQAMLVATAGGGRNLHLHVRCRTSLGGCGVALRYHSDNDLLRVMVDPATCTVSATSTERGHERLLGQSTTQCSPDSWHDLSVEDRDDVLRVVWNGRRAFSADAPRTSEGQRVGLWASASGVASFDELDSQPLLAMSPLRGLLHARASRTDGPWFAEARREDSR
ncbi:hypothetical protein AKJ09_10024 [Labilithrix luteola]|uniref:Uncharacterized protein n=1 Tax=Labilithrix luteola TaxID=1391654 RepID=A0A0K1QC51_9BACT|nr:hypothetical protein [Labilithrix luteola]AKV03361.1 hypothetical protein AKJ09_10024 [Labilithrix luteola]